MPPLSAARSASRNGATSVLRINTDGNRRLPLNLLETDPVEVYCRIKPWIGDDSCVRVLDDTTVALIPPESSVTWKLGTAKEQHYTFQRVFSSEATQKVIFDDIALPLVKVKLNPLQFCYII